MITPDHIKLHNRTVASESAYMKGRVRKLAHKITRMEVCVEGHTYTHFDPQGEETPDSVRADIICRNINYMGRSVGRRAQGAHGTTSGGVWVNGRLVMRSVQNPTSKMRDAKSHKALRVGACDRAHTRAVDGLRTWAHMSAPYRPGGYRWAKLGGVGKRRTRKLLYVCDRHVANGEVTVALELFRGSEK